MYANALVAKSWVPHLPQSHSEWQIHQNKYGSLVMLITVAHFHPVSILLSVLMRHQSIWRCTSPARVYFLSRENDGTERDIEGVGWDMSSPLKLFLALGGNGSLFPQTSAWYLSSVDLGILKWRSAWKYVSSVEAAKEPQPLWNKNARAEHEGISMFAHRELEPKQTRKKQERNQT